MKRTILLLAASLTVAWGQYLPYADAERRLGELARQHADVIKLETYGTSAGGRKLIALTIAGKGTVDPAKRPAIFVGANLVGYHNAGTQAAIALVEKLVANKTAPVLATRTFYVLPALNPDAHDAMFAKTKWRNAANGSQLDRDVDGLVGEDGPDDLNGDGRITQMRIADPNGDYLPDPADARLLKRVDPLKGEKGQYRLYTEGADNDRDGQYNEDPAGGMRPDKNFAHAWNDGDPESGPFPGATPEARAVMDYLLARRNTAYAFVFGPGNNLLDLPRGTGGAATDVGSVRVRPTGFLAAQLGLEANTDYTVDEIFNRVQGSAFAAQAGGQLTKESLASFLGAGPATSPAQEDSRYFQTLAEDYKKALDKAGLDSKRSGRQSQVAGLQNWLYYQYGVMVTELDVWGIPKKKAEAPARAAGGAATANANGPLTIEGIEKMSNDEFVALGEEKLGAYLKEIKAPAQITATMLIEGVKAGRMTPARMAQMMRAQGIGGAGSAAGAAAKPALSGDQADLMDYIDKSAKEAFVNWTPVTLPDGKKAEVGGVDPFVEIAPPAAELTKATGAHADFVTEVAGKLAKVEILSAEATVVSDGLYKVTATVGNTGFLPTHTSHGARIQTWLPVRLQIGVGGGVSLVSGRPQARAERLTGGTGVLKGEWMVRAPKGSRLKLEALTQNAGADQKEIVLQ